MDRSSISTFSIQSSTDESEHSWKREPSEDAEIFPADLSGDEGKPNKEKLNKGQKSSLQGVVVNIVNTAVGCGVIGLPYVIRQLGVVLGAIVLTLGAMVLYVCSNLLMKTKNLSRHSNYVTIAQHCFPKNGYNLLAATLIVNNLGSCVVYLSIFSTVAQNLAETFEPSCAPGPFTPFLCRKNVLIVLGGLLVLPFNFLKSFEKMELAGFFKILSMGLFTFITFGYFVYSMVTGTASTDIDILPSFQDPIGMLACVTQVPLAYNFLFNQFSIYKSMKNATDANMDKAVSTSIGVVGMIYSTIAMSGYAIFGTSTNNVLKNFTIDQLGSFLFIVLNVSFLVASLMTYPPTYFSPRNIIYQAIMNRLNTSYVQLAQKKDHKEEQGHGNLVYIGVVCITNLIIVILAISAPGVNELFGLIGSLATVGLIFIFPPTFYLVLSGRKGKQRPTAIAMLILGTIMGVTGLMANLYKIING